MINSRKLRVLFFSAAVILGIWSIRAMSQPHSEMTEDLDCSKCHTCDKPTASEPCLAACPRHRVFQRSGEHSIGEAPDSLLLSELTDLFGPVHFNHKLHATMAQMGNDCATCHHYSPPGEIPPCRDCHTPNGQGTDLSKPNLKGAYHRQCLACHREWSHDTRCVVCHIPRPGEELAPEKSDPTDIIGVEHPVITVPETEVFTTPYEKAPLVTFHHKQHVELVGLRCVDCHSEESCGNCHDLQKPVVEKKSQEEVHAICNDCHENDPCKKCHDTKKRPTFTHASTGWPLSVYHRDLQCRACHPTGRQIGTMDPSCLSCHAGWNRENFRHAVTGLQLDETHGEFDCTDCHLERRFDRPPDCSGCHDDGRDPREFPPGTWLRAEG